MQLDDRFYSSTEVAEILGVSLRSIYRYLEDNKLKAEVKTATGRHRFTKQNIIDFLYPDGAQQLIDVAAETSTQSLPQQTQQPQVAPQPTPIQPQPAPLPQQQPSSAQPQQQDQVDWLSKFREAASKYKEEQTAQQPYQPQPTPTPAPPPQQQYQPPAPTPTPAPPPPQAPVATGPTLMYYRSMLGGLKDIAQNIDKSARNSNLDYAFTLNAGASLHKPIKPFATLHAYVKPNDRDFYEKILRLTPADKSTAQLCLVVSNDNSIYSSKEEVHGLYVVSKQQLKSDISSFGDPQLAQELADVIG